MQYSAFAKNYKRKRTTQMMRSTCVIWTPGEVQQSSGSGVRASTTYKYEGVCNFWTIDSTVPVAVNDELVARSSKYLSLPFDAPVMKPNDWVKIITSDDDPTMEGRTVEIRSASRGGKLRGSRVYQVEFTETVAKDAW